LIYAKHAGSPYSHALLYNVFTEQAKQENNTSCSIRKLGLVLVLRTEIGNIGLNTQGLGLGNLGLGLDPYAIQSRDWQRA